MKVEARIFDIVTVFAFVVAVVYGVGTHLWAHDGIEPIGLTALILTGGLSLLIGSYFRFIARRIEERPEDRIDAEISDEYLRQAARDPEQRFGNLQRLLWRPGWLKAAFERVQARYDSRRMGHAKADDAELHRLNEQHKYIGRSDVPLLV
jgi:hypothetical protein